MQTFFLTTLVTMALVDMMVMGQESDVPEFIRLGEYRDPYNRVARPIVYELSTSTAGQYQAWANCENIFNGKLLTIDSQDQLNAVRQFLTVNGLRGQSFWTAGIQDGANWVWLTTGQIIVKDQLFWYPGQPQAGGTTASLTLQVNSIGTVAGYNNIWGNAQTMRYICQS